MKIASSTFLFQNIPLNAALSRIRDLGFKHAEISVDVNSRWGHFVPDNIHKEMAESVETIESAVQEAGVGISDITTCFDYTNPAVRGQFEAVCELARKLGVQCVNVSATHPSESMAINCLKDYVSIAANYSVTVTVETFSPSVCEDPATALRLVQMIKGLGLTLDTGYLLSRGFRQETWERLMPHVKLVHIRDAGTETMRYQVPVGTGDLKPDALLDSLKTAGFDGCMVVEYLGPGVWSREKMDYEEESLKMREMMESLLADREVS